MSPQELSYNSAHAQGSYGCLLMQEDLVIRRPSHAQSQGTASTKDPPAYVLSAAAVVFSFGHLQERLGQPMAFLHAPVPGYETDLEALVNRALAGLHTDRPLWRNNW